MPFALQSNCLLPPTLILATILWSLETALKVTQLVICTQGSLFVVQCSNHCTALVSFRPVHPTEFWKIIAVLSHLSSIMELKIHGTLQLSHPETDQTELQHGGYFKCLQTIPQVPGFFQCRNLLSSCVFFFTLGLVHPLEAFQTRSHVLLQNQQSCLLPLGRIGPSAFPSQGERLPDHHIRPLVCDLPPRHSGQ